MIAAALLLAAVLSPADDQRIVSAFVSGNIRSFAPLVANPRELDDAEWSSVRDFLGRYDCITIDGHRLRASGDAVMLEIHGHALTRNARREQREIFETWRVTRDGGRFRIENARAAGGAEPNALLAAAERTDDLAARETLIRQALATIDEADDPRPILLALDNLALSLYLAFDFPRAVAAYNDLQELSERYGWQEGEARALLGQSRILYSTYRREDSMKLASSAAALAAFAGDDATEAVALGCLGQVHYVIKKTSSAPLFKRALEIAPPTDPDELSNLHSRLGIALIGERRFDEAQQHVEPALQLARTPQRKLMAYSFAQSLSHSQGRIAEAIAYGKEGIRVAPNSLRNLWLIQSELGQMLLECGETEEGIAMLRESIDRIEARRTTLPTLMPAPSEAGRAFGNRIFVYHVLEAALLGQGRLEDALSIAERTRGRALFDILHGHRWNRAIPAAEREREHALNQRIVDLNRELARSEGEAALKVREQLLEARAAFDELSLEIDLRYPRGDATTPQPLDLAEIRIDAGTAIVEYSLSADRKTINAYVVRSSGALFGLHLPAPQESVLSEVRLLRKQIESRDGGYRGQAQKLYELLIAPIAAHLEGARHLIIVPDGALWNVPFQALVTPSGEHLAERHAISYAPSLTTLQQRPVRRVARAQKDLLAFGDPLVSEQTTKSATERGLELASLPDAADEVKNLQRLYGAGRSTVYTGAAASEASFKELAPRYRVLHLAAHGIVDDSSPLYSAVVLAAKPDGEEDGFLEMREMRELDLQADLVVLSACDTGRGDLAPGEGMIGMSWALMAAGCPATVVSQWKADSQTTALLMVEFHKELLAGHSPAEALQRAQKKLWRSTKQWSWHPYYWAPFVVVTSTLP